MSTTSPTGSSPPAPIDQKLDKFALVLGLLIGVILGFGIFWSLVVFVDSFWNEPPPPLIVRISLIVLAVVILTFLCARIWWWFRTPRPARFLRQWATNFFLGGTGILAGGITLDVGIEVPWGNGHLKFDGAGWISGVVAAICVVCAMICVLRYADRFPPGTI